MPFRFPRRLLSVDTALNVLLVAAFVFAVGAWTHWYRQPVPVPVQGNEAYREGATLPTLASLPFQRSDKTLVLNVLSTCSVCNDMAPFYLELAEHRAAGRLKYPFYVVSAEKSAELDAYLGKHGLKPDVSVSIANTDFKSRFVPSLYLVGSQGTVERLWTGRLNPQRQAEVRAAISVPQPGAS